MVIVRDFDRPAADVVEGLAEHSAADVHEAMGKRNAMAPEMGPVGDGTTVCGPACTARLHPGDNMMAHVAVEYARPGDVVVLEAPSHRAATWGELASRNAMRGGVAGLVSGGNVRDAAWLADSEFPVFAPAVSQAGAVKETPGSVNVPVSVGGVTVSPGDVIVGDADGVTVVPREDAREVLAAAADVVEHEATVRTRIAEGESLHDLLGLGEKLAERDVRVVDTREDL